jgi:ParB family transcriptional regulator, chromosome partitioning protein
VGRRSGLGKGLGALIPASERAEDSESELREIPIANIEPNQHQPRNYFDEEALVSLAASISEVGILQPILVRAAGNDHYELIAGERRWRAAKRAGLQTIPAIVRTVETEQSLEQALVENLHREDLSPLEEAAAFHQLMEEFGLTQERVAERVGKSRSTVANTIRLLQLPPAVQRMISRGELSAGHARALLGSPDRNFQEELAQLAVDEELTVREVEEQVRLHLAGDADESPAVGEPPTEDSPEKPPSTPGSTKSAALLELEDLLGSHLDTRVLVSMGSAKGRMVIDFATIEDLERIYRVILEGRETI